MPSLPISNLPAGGDTLPGDLFVSVQGGVTVKVTTGQIAAAFAVPGPPGPPGPAGPAGSGGTSILLGIGPGELLGVVGTVEVLAL